MKAASSDEEIDTALDSFLNLDEELECGHTDAGQVCGPCAHNGVDAEEQAEAESEVRDFLYASF